MTTDKNNHANDFTAADYPLRPVGNTLALQALIIETARSTPQIIDSTPAPRASRSNFWLRPNFASMACVALLLVFGLGFLSLNIGGEDVPLDVLSENDLEWQELMLINDELLFAQL